MTNPMNHEIRPRTPEEIARRTDAVLGYRPRSGEELAAITATALAMPRCCADEIVILAEYECRACGAPVSNECELAHGAWCGAHVLDEDFESEEPCDNG